MGSVLQKKKRRSSRQPIRQSNRPKKPLNPRGNTLIAKNWDKKETLSQNYRRLGLVARLKAPTGGTELKLHDKKTHPSGTNPTASLSARKRAKDPFAINNIEQSIISEAKVERDADGKIIRIISRTGDNPLKDHLRDLDSDSEGETNKDGDEGWGGIEDDGGGEGQTEVVRSLLEAASNPAERKPRHQSEGEMEWLQRLVARHDDDFGAMARDIRLNPMQQTAADLKKRVKKMQAAQSG